MKNIFKLISSTLNAIFNGIISLSVGLFKGIYKGIVVISTGVYKGIAAILKGIYSGIVALYKGIYSLSKKIYTQCLPTYSVVFTMYHVIPGVPIQKNDSVHKFEKGASKEAAAFFEKVVQTTKNNKIAPTEIKLKKGRRVVQLQQFGPINEILKLKIAA